MGKKINNKTGKPYSRQTIWRHSHPEKIEQFRAYSKTPEALLKSSIRTLKNKEHLREVKRLYYQNHKIKMAKVARESRKLEVAKAHNISTYNYEKKYYCEICGNTNEKLETHHWNYNNPLMVNTLCRTCHKIQHLKDFARWHVCKIEADKQLNNMRTLY